MLRRSQISIGIMVLVLIGCSGSKGKKTLPTYKTSGIVTMGGKPFGPCQLILEPKPLTVDLNSSIAQVGADGKFKEMRTYKPGDGMPEGTFEIRLLPDVMAGVGIPGFNSKSISINKPTSGTIELKIELEPNGKPGGLPTDDNAAPTDSAPMAVP